MTAIAAVLALTPTNVLAQTAETPPSAQTPIVETTGEIPPVTTSADPLSPTTAAPIEETAPAETNETTEAPSTAGPAPVARSSARAARNVSRPAASAPAPRNPAPIAAQPAPAAAAAVETPMAPPQPLAVAPTPEAVAPVANPVAAQDPTINDMLPIAGAAGLGALALLGTGLVVRRRRRRDDEFDGDYEASSWERPEESTHRPLAEPAFARSAPHARPIHDPTPMPSAALAAPTTKLPNGFDISKFGRHVQAAYRGPTKDNPSLSLKNRLRRASFLDQREREAAASHHGPAAAPTPEVRERQQQPQPGFVLARKRTDTSRDKRHAPAFRPAYQF